ncbi:DExH-box splicing factor binding site-domain-containing protein [Hypomontagnella submonticulosa]|nr:DExH-box splicing factor binding site-domain-containing protein [Hypomontagnella submonticulosa]
MSEPAPRIAIKFGNPSSSSKSANGANKQSRAQPSSTLGKRQRPHALNHDSDSGSDEEGATRQEIVTTFGGDSPDSGSKRRNTNGNKSKRPNAPYVITGHKNRDWKADLKSQRDTKADASGQVRVQSNGPAEMDPADQDKNIKWGLTLTKKPAQDNPEVTDETAQSEDVSIILDSTTPHPDDNGDPSKNEDNDAMDALLGKKRKSAKDLVIEHTSRHSTPGTPSEQDLYRRRMEEAADISTIEEYDQIPEGEFGAAMLRGMGWKGEEQGSRPKEVKRRPHLMGLGSKEDEEIKKAELARKHGHRERRPRLDEYRRDKEKERRDREERHGSSSYKSEREREQRDHGRSHSNRERDRDRDRDRDRNSYRHTDRGYRR